MFHKDSFRIYISYFYICLIHLQKRNRLNMSKKPILYMHALSPPARAVMLTAAALGIDLELKPVDLLSAEHKKPEFIKVSWRFHRIKVG